MTPYTHELLTPERVAHSQELQNTIRNQAQELYTAIFNRAETENRSYNIPYNTLTDQAGNVYLTQPFLPIIRPTERE